mmetsp:Transcript_26595/g.54933  ORF Transcript_26595/g.54933 Transcript_26595/m.54933 type:complete len:235 (+) Transcript_26595:1773-2477(+)
MRGRRKGRREGTHERRRVRSARGRKEKPCRRRRRCCRRHLSLLPPSSSSSFRKCGDRGDCFGNEPSRPPLARGLVSLPSMACSGNRDPLLWWQQPLLSSWAIPESDRAGVAPPLHSFCPGLRGGRWFCRQETRSRQQRICCCRCSCRRSCCCLVCAAGPFLVSSRETLRVLPSSALPRPTSLLLPGHRASCRRSGVMTQRRRKTSCAGKRDASGQPRRRSRKENCTGSGAEIWW